MDTRCRRADRDRGAVNPRTVLLQHAGEMLIGKAVDEVLVDGVGDLAERAAKPLTTSTLTPGYRREMIRVFSKRGVSRSEQLSAIA
ncbi:MAG TPA: hypothetical protein VMU26_25430 [Candidatus Polarisedimenticolia bacterium]|nr:hypothetical protein [Candidatus Polarisedimenticolia bacterium]